MFTQCSNWDVILWYTSTWIKICWEVWSDWILDNSLTASDLASNSVWADEVATWAVWSDEVSNNSLTASDLATNSVWADEIAVNAVWSSEVDNWSLTLNDIDISSFDTRYLGRFWWMYTYNKDWTCRYWNPLNSGNCSCPTWFSFRMIDDFYNPDCTNWWYADWWRTTGCWMNQYFCYR